MAVNERIEQFLEKGILISPELLNELEGIDIERVKQKAAEFLVYSKEDHLKNKKNPVEIVFNYVEEPKKRTVKDFVSLFHKRFKGLESILKARQELTGLTSISRVLQKAPKERVSIIGMVQEKSETKNGNFILTLEDFTGEIKVLLSKRNEDILEIAKDLMLDETIGITGVLGDGIVFADAVVFPDIPLTKELKKCPEEIYMVCLGDPHVGSKEFLKESFKRFLLWINGRMGDETQRALAKKVKYVVVTGDIIEGVGIYPGQENDLEYETVEEQYSVFAEYIKNIPSHIQIILFPGNHDVGRIAEPQPSLFSDFAQSVLDLPNVTSVSNPAIVNIAKTESFPGFDLLLYHGGSLIYYSDNLPSVRALGGQKRCDLVMKYLLQRRHLAPTHTSTLYVPDAKMDPLLISRVPDFFITGHIHRIAVGSYRNVTLINASCWGDITDDQIKRGLDPQPGRVPLINLQTREVKIMNFYVKNKKRE